MQTYRKEEMVQDVRTALDANPRDTALLSTGDVDTLTLDRLVGSKIEEAVRRVHLCAPPGLIDSGLPLRGGVHWEEQESGWLLLPEDFMRLLVFRMSDWARPVFALSDVSEASYALTGSPFKALRGTPGRPRAYLVQRPEGRALAFYSCKSREATMAEGTYLPYPRFDALGGILICPALYGASVLTAASLTASALSEGERAEALMAQGRSLMEQA